MIRLVYVFEKNIKLVQVQNDGLDEFECLLEDCRNFINQNRKLLLQQGDAESIRKFFNEMQSKDNDFFH